MPSIASKIREEIDGTTRLEHSTKNLSFEYVRYPDGKEILAIQDKETDQLVELHNREISTLLNVIDVIN